MHHIPLVRKTRCVFMCWQKWVTPCIIFPRVKKTAWVCGPKWVSPASYSAGKENGLRALSRIVCFPLYRLVWKSTAFHGRAQCFPAIGRRVSVLWNLCSETKYDQRWIHFYYGVCCYFDIRRALWFVIAISEACMFSFYFGLIFFLFICYFMYLFICCLLLFFIFLSISKAYILSFILGWSIFIWFLY